MAVLKLASLLIAVANSDNVFNKSGLEFTRFTICWFTYACDAIFAPANWFNVNNIKALILYWFELYIKDIGVFESTVKIFETDAFVKFAVVDLITLVCMGFDNFWRQKKTNLMKKNQFTVCVVFDIFLMTYVILIAEAFYMSLDAILPLFDGWRRYIYQNIQCTKYDIW